MRRFVLPAVLAAAASSACSTNVTLVDRTRLTIVAPSDNAAVVLPVEVRWEARGAPSFLVVVDRAPPPPGHGIDWLARDDENCATTPGCPDAGYLERRWAFRTSSPRLVLRRLPPAGESRRSHRITVVVVDERGRRVGDAAAWVEVRRGP